MDQSVSVEKDVAVSLLNMQRERDRLFDPALFSNPAWDILLTLCVHAEGCSLNELQDMMPGVSEGTMARWIKVLEGRRVISSTDNVVGPPVYQLTIEARVKGVAAFKSSALFPFV